VCSQLAPLPRSGCCPVRALVSGSKSMQAVYARCCGLDVHQKPVVAWVLVSEAEGEVRRQVRTVSTMTTDLLALNDGLTALPCPALPCPALPCPGDRARGAGIDRGVLATALHSARGRS
jgi:hypothetical protein